MAAAARNKVLVLNAGSSSLKFKVFEALGVGAAAGGAAATGLHPIAAGLCERIADPEGGAVMKASAGPASWREGRRFEEPLPDHGAALRLVARFLHSSFSPAFEAEVLGVGHRVVHGGSIGESVLVDERSSAAIRDACHLAPLHNPPSLHCIEAAQALFPDSPQVAVFDTTFHRTML